ncbi:MAG: ABC transporter ATP-binding protein [Pegethrix bostrychoides GSE-TBD4-15B]|jgi:spermidine/putrescine transport system ATP-binding protein|uniref:Spermidine/putrescine import ATP-binding protein PotA n=1 Tax=Pegethrix bostrychoides GSE-TBD4-15B TaxID=2839662 RepID=A0A951PC58_9CYAN|nr:ABC transporter ATP-binding protein [Pegethrix bostrychoides GSE-TBD4-15B]
MSQTVIQQDVAETDTMFDVELRKVFKVYNGETAVRNIDLNIRQGEFFSILGPSGCGKTTTLRMIAGFEEPTGGEVLIRGQSMANVPPYKRPVNTVFQSYALFGHMSVWDNVAFGLRLKDCPKSELQQRVGESLELVKMDSLARRFPAQLSGGQQQRVALARALVNRPTVVLLDEPLGALDLKLRKEMQLELTTLHRDLGVTFVMVTHDQEEALSLSDRIAVMNIGKIEQIGTPTEIYEQPCTAFIADFIGDTNLMPAELATLQGETVEATTRSGLKIWVKPQALFKENPTREVLVSIRPEKIQLGSTDSSEIANRYDGTLKHVMYLGNHTHYQVELPSGDVITVFQTNRSSEQLKPGMPIQIYWSASDSLALPV